MWYISFILYLLIYIAIISFIFLHYKKYVYYYKCTIQTEYHPNKNVIPLCSVDIKYGIIKFYGYFIDDRNSNYHYKTNTIFIHDYNNTIFDNKANISIQKLEISKKRISLCIVSVYSNLNIINIVRTCLMYRKLGVQHITLYISFYNKEYKKYYDWFKTRSWIETINFTLPNISTYLYGQDAKLNHCINHYRYISDYVIVTDVDEIILPQKRINLIDIIDKYGKNNFVFSFKSVLFYVNSISSSIFLTNKTGCMIKSGYEKMILRPEKIISIGAHFPKIWQEKGKIIFVNKKDAFVRHARIKTGSRLLDNLNCTVRVNEVDYFSYLIRKIEYYIKWI